MAVANSGMTLYTFNDTQETWSGSDDLDTEVFVQETGSESWLVGKNDTISYRGEIAQYKMKVKPQGII